MIDGIWDNIYATSISEAKSMYTLAEQDGNTNLMGISLVMQAIGFQTLTDLFGPIPFTEALNPTILKPVYDDEAVVYAGVIQMLTDAADLLSNGTGTVPGSSRPFLRWRCFQMEKISEFLKVQSFDENFS